MTTVLVYGILSVLPLPIGALLGAHSKLKERIIGIIAAFGAGALIAALTFGLMEESFRLGGIDNSVIGFLIGGILFVIGDLIIIQIGGRGHRRVYDVEASTGWGIVLGAILDGIPESIALGISLVTSAQVGLLLLVGVILNNLPEAISSGYDLRESRKSPKEILGTWIFVAIVGFTFVLFGNTILAGVSNHFVATFQSLAAGAILAMLASTMMPEAYKESGTWASLATVAGFMIIFVLSKVGI